MMAGASPSTWGRLVLTENLRPAMDRARWHQSHKHGTDARVRQDSSDGIISVGLSRWLGKAGTVDAAG